MRIIARHHLDCQKKVRSQWSKMLLEAPHEHSEFSKAMAEAAGVPLLNQAEGGISGDSNRRDKQVRFSEGLLGIQRLSYLNYDELAMECLNPDDDQLPGWSPEEVSHIRNAFRECCGGACVFLSMHINKTIAQMCIRHGE